MKLVYLAILLLITLNGHLVRSDGTKDDVDSDTESGDDVEITSENRKTIEAFFNKAGIAIHKDSLKNYSPDVVEMMGKALKDGEEEYNMGSQVRKFNTFIYENELKRVGLTEKPRDLVTPNYDVVLGTIDLIVPDCWADPMIKLYKAELNLFYKNKPELAKELLMIMHKQLSQTLIDTRRAIVKLRHFYYHWIALSDLADYIEKNASN